MKTEESSSVSSGKPLLTVAYLETLPDDNNRYELIAGELFVSCAPGLPHQLALQRLQVALAKYLEVNPIGIVAPGAGAVFSDYDSVIPDLVFVLNERWEKIVANDRFVAAPNLVIEVVSPGKENRNRNFRAKRQLYEKYGVEEYWIVDRGNRCRDDLSHAGRNSGGNGDTARQRSVDLTIAYRFQLGGRLTFRLSIESTLLGPV